MVRNGAFPMGREKSCVWTGNEVALIQIITPEYKVNRSSFLCSTTRRLLSSVYGESRCNFIWTRVKSLGRKVQTSFQHNFSYVCHFSAVALEDNVA